MPLAIGLLLVLVPSFAYALPGESDITPLNNRDVLMMVQKHLSEEAIVKAIKTSPCTFDTFPPVLQDMKRRGVSDAVLQAMVDAPYGPSLQTTITDSKDEQGEQPIYHYTDQLQRLGYLAPSTSRQPSRFPRNSRLRANSRTRR
jgi:hypothetical protein